MSKRMDKKKKRGTLPVLPKEEQTKNQKKPMYLKYGIQVVLVVLILMIYGETTNFEFAIDDTILVTENQYVQNGLSGMGRLFSDMANGDWELQTISITRPLTAVSHALDVSLFGMEPQHHHMMNLVYYIALVLLLFQIMKRYLLKGRPMLTILAILVIFTVHPVHVESVANIKGRDDILCFLAIALSLWWLFKAEEERSGFWKGLSMIAFTASLFFKETGVAFALLIPLTFYYFQTQPLKSVVRKTWPYLAIGLAFMLFRMLHLENDSRYLNEFNNSLITLDTPDRLIMTFYILGYYLKLLFWPHPLNWDYSSGHFSMEDGTLPAAIISLVIYITLLGFAVWGIKKKHPATYGIWFYLLTLFPVSNLLVIILATMAERFLFIPLFGFSWAIVFAVEAVVKKARAGRRKGHAVYYLWIGAPAVIVLFALLASARASDWRDSETLILADVEHGRSIRTQTFYLQHLTGLSDNRIQNHMKALDHCKKTLERFPDDTKLWFIYGVIQSELGNTPESIKGYEKAVEKDPENTLALTNLGQHYVDRDAEKAMAYFRQASEADLNNALAAGNLAIMLHQRGRLEEAIPFYERAVNSGSAEKNILDGYAILKDDLGLE